MSEIAKLRKKMARLEKKFETASPVMRKRIMKSASATSKKIARLKGD